MNQDTAHERIRADAMSPTWWLAREPIFGSLLHAAYTKQWGLATELLEEMVTDEIDDALYDQED